ncbi:MAG: MarR family transcriptional regulator [Candidatus Helarchaeota archaeon]
MDWNSQFRNNYRNLYSLPPSAKFVLYILNLKGTISRKELINQTLLSSRTIGHALKILLENGLIRKERLVKKSRRDKIDKRIVKYCLNNIN